MFQAVLVGAAQSKDTVPAWLLAATAGISAVGVIAAAALSPFAQRLSRRDSMRTYKRELYRNFLDHGFWLRALSNGEDDWKGRARSYTADFYRIQLLAGDELLEVIRKYREPGSLDVAAEERLLGEMKRDLRKTQLRPGRGTEREASKQGEPSQPLA
jgi:hypothetical protein